MMDLVRIGCGAGFWGDSAEGAAQLVSSGGIDYLVLDYLAEITMSILARMRAKKPDSGYVPDFVTMVMKPLAKELARRRIKVVTNAGGLNAEACRNALAAALAEQNVDLRIALVQGDDLSAQSESLCHRNICDMFSEAPMPKKLASVNAYLGAFPIAAALNLGADVVLTGRCVDSALVLGPLIHEFGWQADNYDLLAAGSLAGHIIECGAQATGGLMTDWRAVDGWDRMGFPIAECKPDGNFEITKPARTGGLVSVASVGEQIVYEVGDPAEYLLPDVACDFSFVRLTEAGADRVRVEGARGSPPTASYKVSATYADGYRSTATMMIVGRDAPDKARRVGEAVLARSRRLMAAAGHSPFAETSIEILGAEANYGAHSRGAEVREVVLKIAARHKSEDALRIFAREIYPAATSMAQGLTGFSGGRPEPQALIRPFSFLIEKADVPVTVTMEGQTHNAPIVVPSRTEAPQRSHSPSSALVDDQPAVTVPLIALAYGRSGDKGDIANIGVIARNGAFLDVLRRDLTPEAVRSYFAHFVKGNVERFEWPGLNAFNFLLHGGLGGGGVASLRHDPQGKALAQILMDFPVKAPASWLEPGGHLADWRDPRGRPAVQEAAQ
jgi:hypothetical protein